MRFAVVDLHPADRDIVAVLGMTDKAKPDGDKRTGILGVVGTDRQPAKIGIVTRENHFLARAVFDDARRNMVSETFHDLLMNFFRRCL